ncbi:glycolate oxidase [Xylariaceae sp. FL0255]|nr:glycolate oxidase [Xylariaceae sp. FL0255]
MIQIEGAEVAKHNQKQDCWIVLHGKVWDVSEFLDGHPGGAAVIFKYAGGDATEAYEEVHDPELVSSTLPAAKCLGPLRPDSLPKAQPVASPKSSPTTATKSELPPLRTIVNVGDFEKVAEKYLTPAGWAYYSSGAEDEYSITEAHRLFRKITFRPRVMRKVEPISTDVNILGYNSSLPVYISPTGTGRYAHKDAECIFSRGAGRAGIIYCMPTTSNHRAVLEARTKPDQPVFLQLYTTRDRAKAQAMIRNAEFLGAKAVFVTVDSPVLGRRERDERVMVAEGGDASANTGVARTGSMSILNPMLTWEDLKWLRKTTSLPLVLKGIATVEDAVLAFHHGVQGIVLSHHGGRSLDTTQAPILTLLEIRKYAAHLLSPEIRDRFQIFIDGGFRRGTDIIKALALGATAVGIGRPSLYSVCAGYGEAGLKRLLQMLQFEIETGMALAGATSVTELVPELLNTERAENEVSRRVKL